MHGSSGHQPIYDKLSTNPTFHATLYLAKGSQALLAELVGLAGPLP
jgi:hypothetical protein